MEGAEDQASADGPLTVYLQALLGAVLLVAGFVGPAMVAFPGSTGRFFVWALGPPATASLTGGFYLASAWVFGLGLLATWREVRGLCVGVVALGVPLLVVTATERESLDFGRWQSILFVALNAAAIVAAAVGLGARSPRLAGTGPRLVTAARVVLALLAALMAALAGGLLLAPRAVALRAPVYLTFLSARFLGCWCLFLAALAAWSAARNRWNEARLPLLGLALAPVAAFAAAARSAGTLVPGRRLEYAAGLVVLFLTSFGVLTLGREVQA